jgi:hypothetical protein
MGADGERSNLRFDTDPHPRRFAPLLRAGQSRRWAASGWLDTVRDSPGPEVAVKEQLRSPGAWDDQVGAHVDVRL